MQKEIHDLQAAEKRTVKYDKPWFNAILNQIKIKNISGTKVLDIGAGKGEFLSQLQRLNSFKSFYAIDYVVPNIEALEGRGYHCKKIDLETLGLDPLPEFKDEKFDLITCLEVIEHVFNFDMVLRLISHSLKTNGTCIISTPNTASVWDKLFYLVRGYPYSQNHHVSFFTKQRLIRAAFLNGLDLQDDWSFSQFGRGYVQRAFGFRSVLLNRVITFCLFLPFKLLDVLSGGYFSSTQAGMILVFKRNELPPIGFDLETMEQSFSKLPPAFKEIWIAKLNEYVRRDRFSDWIYVPKFLRSIGVKV